MGEAEVSPFRVDLDDFNWDSPEEWPWEEIEYIHIVRDDDGWDVSVEIDGILIDVLDGLDDEDASDLIWDEIWHWADEYGIDVDKDVEYSED